MSRYYLTDDGVRIDFYKATGCQRCAGTGKITIYRGGGLKDVPCPQCQTVKK